ncbi:MAG: family 10 glycosylhydrolase [Kiritimatiellaeota bacterium]|nr:family 10 glycosylhydrolase [Kiritimatiellota bacterium]
MSGLAFCAAGDLEGGDMAFAGLRALLIRPENSWSGWDSALFGALEFKGIEVTWAEPAALEDEKALQRYDFVATTIKRRFTPKQIKGLTAYVRAGGALYGSWGGPMGCPELLAFCGIKRTRSVYIKELTMLPGPLAKGLGQLHWRLPQFVGHTNLGDKGRELVAVVPADGTAVARDVEGNSLGVIQRRGRGRTAVLGFGPEKAKSHFRSIVDAAVVMDNLLRWLVPDAPRRQAWPGTIQVSLPARTDVKGAWADGAPVLKPRVRTFGSLKQVTFDVSRVPVDATMTLRVRFAPLAKTRNIETLIHMPATLRDFDTPLEAADYVASFHPTIVQPLLRGGSGYALYRGMAEDTPNKKLVTDYPGDYLAEFVDLCHRRGIKVIGGVYFAFPKTLLKAHPNAIRIGKDGKPDPKGRICFNRPEVQDYNFRTVRQLLDNYALDGLILDDNFELDGHPCYCRHCKTRFRAYCDQQGVAYQDPATTPDPTLQKLWIASKREATLALARQVRAIAAAHRVPAGGWVNVGMKPTYLAAAFDFLGGMVYTAPAWSVRGPLSVLGDRGYITLLWGTDRAPADLEAETVEAIRAGSSTVGFWVLAREGGAKAGRFHMREGSFAAIARALQGAEAQWLDFYRDNLVTGDARFVVTGASLSREELTLTVKNLGRRAKRRLQCRLDLSAVEYPDGDD